MIADALRALRHRNFRLFFCGQSLSLIGTWMTRLATSWLVYRLTGSPFLLGVVSFASQIPTFVLGPILPALLLTHLHAPWGDRELLNLTRSFNRKPVATKLFLDGRDVVRHLPDRAESHLA